MRAKKSLSKTSIRTCLLYDFKSNLTASNSCRRINIAFGPDTVSVTTACEWFKRFRAGDESLEDQPRSGRPSEIDDDALLSMVEAKPHLTTREMAAALSVSQPTIVTRLRSIGKVCELDISVPNQLPKLESEPNTAPVNQTSILDDQSYTYPNNYDPPFKIMDVKIQIPEVDAKSLSSDKFYVKEEEKLNDYEASFGIETIQDDDDYYDLFRKKHFIQIFKNDPFASGVYECRTCHRIIKCRPNDTNTLKRHLRAKICQRKGEILTKVKQERADPLSLLSIETNKSNAYCIEDSESTDNSNELEAGPSKRAKTNCKYQCPVTDCDFSDLCRESVITHTKEQHLCGGDTWVLEPISIDLAKPMLTDLSQFHDSFNGI